MISWRQKNSNKRKLCVNRSRPEFVMTERRGGRVPTEFALQDSKFADGTTFLFPSRDQTTSAIPLVYMYIFGN